MGAFGANNSCRVRLAAVCLLGGKLGTDGCCSLRCFLTERNRGRRWPYNERKFPERCSTDLFATFLVSRWDQRVARWNSGFFGSLDLCYFVLSRLRLLRV